MRYGGRAPGEGERPAVGRSLEAPASPTMKYSRAFIVLLIIGGTVGPCLDALHTYSGATWYPDPQLFRSVWWCPPLFAFAGVAIGMPRVFIDQRLDGRVLSPSGHAVAWKMGLFFVGYALSGFLPAPWWVKLAVLLAFFFAALWPLDTRGAFLGAAGAAFGG